VCLITALPITVDTLKQSNEHKIGTKDNLTSPGRFRGNEDGTNQKERADTMSDRLSFEISLLCHNNNYFPF
jgi:hypothetical protein